MSDNPVVLVEGLGVTIGERRWELFYRAFWRWAAQFDCEREFHDAVNCRMRGVYYTASLLTAHIANRWKDEADTGGRPRAYRWAPQVARHLLHEVIGPARPNRITLSSDVLGLARSIAIGGRWGDMPILADSLEEAGETDERVLKHCRQQAIVCACCGGQGFILEQFRESRRYKWADHLSVREMTELRRVDCSHCDDVKFPHHGPGCWVIEGILIQ